MTTILYAPKEQALYADGQETDGDNVCSTTARKISAVNIKTLGLCLVATCGTVPHIDLVLNYLKTGIGDIPHEILECSGLILSSKGIVYPFYGFPHNLKGKSSQSEIYTDGSGRAIARAAYRGCAIEAMSKAKELDIYSGGITTKAYFYKGMPVFEVVK